jgi:hypothetical protein
MYIPLVWMDDMNRWAMATNKSYPSVPAAQHDFPNAKVILASYYSLFDLESPTLEAREDLDETVQH